MRVIVLIFLLLATNAGAQEDKSKEVEKRCTEFSAEVEKFLGGKFDKPVPVSLRNAAFFRELALKSMREETSDEEMKLIRLIWERLRILPKDFDLESRLAGYMAGQIAGLYDPATKQFYISDSLRGVNSAEFTITAVHELIHAYRDVHTDFWERTKALSSVDEDWASAVRCFVEGEATLLGLGLGEALKLRGDPGAFTLAYANVLKKSGAMAAGGFIPGIPLAIQRYFLVAYEDGPVLAAHLYVKGGVGAIAEAYKNPPRSMEQVLHPEKYVGPEVDEPTVFVGGDPTGHLGKGWALRRRGTLGELDMRVMFEKHLGRRRALEVGEGWDGIRYHFCTHGDGRSFLGLVSTWDSEKDAREFARAWHDWALKRDDGNVVLASADVGIHTVKTRDGIVAVLLKGRDVVVADGTHLEGMVGVLKALRVTERRDRKADEKPPAGE
jgi:hypothetical protein